MKTLLPGLGTAVLGIAVLLTLALALTTKLFTLRPPSGPDAMGLVVVFFLPVVAWLLVLAGALVCVARGGFDWLSRSGGIPTLAVVGTTVGLGGLSVAAAVFSLEVRYSTSSGPRRRRSPRHGGSGRLGRPSRRSPSLPSAVASWPW